ALALAEELAAAFPEDAGAHFVLGGAHDAQGREHEAVVCYRRALALGLTGKDLPGFYVQYGSTLRNVGEFAEAVRVLEEGVRRFPELLSLRAFLSLAQFSDGRAEDAVATALDALMLGSGAAPDLTRYGRSLRAYISDLQGADEDG
ncbi:MAG: tetratricopeptide repeat protein, partial [Thermomicrobiales bacterium]